MLALLLALFAAGTANAQTPRDPAGPACLSWQSQWRAEGQTMTLAQAQAFRAQLGPTCAGTRAAVDARIAQLSRAAPPPPDACASARAAWPYLRRSTDRQALRDFIAATPSQCAERTQAQQRLNGLPRDTATPPVTTTTQPPTTTSTAWRAGQTFDDCSGAGWCPRMVVIPAGSFMMGSPDGETGRESDEGPQRRVSIRQFAVGTFEVTFDQWATCVNRGGCTGNANPADQGWGRGSRPVINVSWNDAREYVQWLSRDTRQTYRLLTEAEWEYAARAGTTTAYSTGASISTSQANFNITLGRTQTVGAYAASAFGLHDMHGNVWEWVQDCYAASYSGLPTDGSASEIDCSYRVYRGGSWLISPRNNRSAQRIRSTPANRGSVLGFRVARTLN